MKFFVPFAKTADQTQNLYEGIIQFCQGIAGQTVTNRKICVIKYQYEGKDYYAQVGQVEYRHGEIIVAILEMRDVYLICTPNCGVLGGEPICVASSSIQQIIDFED